MALAAPPDHRKRTARRLERTILPSSPPRDAEPFKRLLLDGRRLDMQVGDRLTGAMLERTIEGANTLTPELWNGDSAVIASGVFGTLEQDNDVRVELDGLGFVVDGLSKQGESISAPAGDEVIAKLKRHGKTRPLRFPRGQWTRVHACATMIRDAGTPVLVVDENVAQPLANQVRAARRETPSTPRSRSSKRPLANAGITIKGVRANAGQLRNIAVIMGEAEKLRASEKATMAMLVAAIGESSIEKSAAEHVYGTHKGVFQSNQIPASDLAGQAHYFLVGGRSFKAGGAIRLARQEPHASVGEIARRVEISDGGTSYYNGFAGEARRIYQAARGADLSTPSTVTTTTTKQYAFDRRRGESTWAACWRLLVTEVRWRLFVREGVVIIASDPALMRHRPVFTATERSAAVETIDFDWARALRVNEMTITAYVGRWQADPGDVVEVPDLPLGKRNWIVASVRAPLLGSTVQLAEIGLRLPQAPLPEPAPETVTTTTPGSGRRSTSGLVAGAKGTAERLYAECKKISDAGGPYSHAGHGVRLSGVTNMKAGLDCSSSVSLALYRAGLYDHGIARVSGQFGSWGAAGHGKQFTVFYSPDHIFIVFHGFPADRFDTSPHGSGGRGPRLRFTPRSTSGFGVRHWPGL